MMFRQRECQVKRSSYGGRGLETYKEKLTRKKWLAVILRARCRIVRVEV